MHCFCNSVKTYVKDCNHNVGLVCYKSRVAPLKSITLPHLELCGALLLASLSSNISNSLPTEISNAYYWTDSAIVLTWNNACPGRWNIFVANKKPFSIGSSLGLLTESFQLPIKCKVMQSGVNLRWNSNINTLKRIWEIENSRYHK